MKTRSLFLAGALALFSLSIANAKSYHIMLDNPAKAGNTMLTAGEYKLTVKGANAVFTNTQTSQTVSAPVRVGNNDKKHIQTAVEITTQNGTERIHAIELGGSTETLEFGD